MRSREGGGGARRPREKAGAAPAAGSHALGGVPEPYRLRVVAHSLGGAALLIYAVMCRRLGRPHHLYRLILLTPAGFLEKLPLVRAQPGGQHASALCWHHGRAARCERTAC